MEQKIVLTGIARSKGKAAGEAIVVRQRMGWAFNFVGNEDGIVMQADSDARGMSIVGKIVAYPTLLGSTTSATSLFFKCTQSHHGPASHHLPASPRCRHQRSHCRWNPRRGQLGPGPDHDHQDGRLGGNRRAEGRPEGHGHDHAQGIVRLDDIGNATRRREITMAMKLTKYQQEMLDGKHGETKKYCMEKLVDFGEAVDAQEMVDVTMVLNCCPILSKDRRNPETAHKLEMYDLGHSALYDPIFAIKDAHVADESGIQAGNDPYLVQFDKVEEKGYPWNFELPGKGGYTIDKEMVTDLKAGYDKLMEHGWLPWMSCQPQFNTSIPKLGEYCAISESSVAAYVNTILGARTNRESPVISNRATTDSVG